MTNEKANPTLTLGKGLNRNWCGKTTVFLPFFRPFTVSYAKIKKYSFFTLNAIVKTLISYNSLRNRLILLTTLIPVNGVRCHTSSG